MLSHYQSNFAHRMEAMLAYKEAMGYSRSTFEGNLRLFDQFCISHFPEEHDLTQKLVMAWLRKKNSESVNGLKRRFSTIRQFGLYLQSIGEPGYILPTKMTGSQKQYTPYLFTDEELFAFFSGSDKFCQTPGDPLACYIVPVIFRLIYSCGLRPGEARVLLMDDVNLESGRVLIRQSKRHKDRVIMLSDDMLCLCRKYAVIREVYQSNSNYLFPGKERTPRDMQWLYNQFKRCWKLAGITFSNGSIPRIYDLRHTFASRCFHNWMNEKQDLYHWVPYLSAYMGHTKFSCTAYYIHLLPDRLIRSSAINWQTFSDLLPEVTP